MSKENTGYDVSIALYSVSKGKGNAAVVTFFNDTELVLDCTRVKLVRDGDKLYFHRGDLVKDSIKLSGYAYADCKNLLQLHTDYSKVKDMEGTYDLKYDKDVDLYYIDKQECVSAYIHKNPSRKGIKQLNHNPGEREKRGEYVMSPRLTDKGKSVANAKQVEKQEQESSKKKVMEKTAATTIVIKALINLLKVQVEGNEDALSTIDALEKYI